MESEPIEDRIRRLVASGEPPIPPNKRSNPQPRVHLPSGPLAQQQNPYSQLPHQTIATVPSNVNQPIKSAQNNRGNFQTQPYAPGGRGQGTQRQIVHPHQYGPTGQGRGNAPRPAFVPARQAQATGQQPSTMDPDAYSRGGRVAGYYQQHRPQQRQLFDPTARRGPPGMLPDVHIKQVAYLDEVAKHEVAKVEQSQAERDEKEGQRLKLEQIIHDVCEADPGRLPKVSLECFGSFKSGFATADSDMDLVIVLQDGTPYTACFSLLEDDLPRALEKRLLQLGYGARLLTRTRVPIIKICEKPGESLLDKLREEREKWDVLPNEKKYPHLHPEGDDDSAPAHEGVATTMQAETASGDSDAVTQEHIDVEPALEKKDADSSMAAAKALPNGHQHLPKPNGANGETQVGDAGSQKQMPKRDMRPFTRERKAGPLDFPKDGVGIQSDINFFNPLGLHNTQLLRCYALCDPRVRPMVLFVKSWAKQRKINSSYSGTLSSYGYVLMVLHYLMNVAQPPVIPNLQSPWRPDAQCVPSSATCTEVDGWKVDFWRNENEITRAVKLGQMSSSRESLGSLLNGFFQYYSSQGGFPQFHWTQEVLSLRSPGGILRKDEKGWTKAVTEEGDGKKVQHRYLFCIEDPFELSHNVARTVTHNGIVAIRDEFRRAFRILRAIGHGQQAVDGELFARLIETDDIIKATEALKLEGAGGQPSQNQNDPMASAAISSQGANMNGHNAQRMNTSQASQQRGDRAGVQSCNGSAKAKQLDLADKEDFPSLGRAPKAKAAKIKSTPQVDPAQRKQGYIKNVHKGVSVDEVKKHLSQYGEIMSLDIVPQKKAAFIEFETVDGLNAAIVANPHQIGLATLNVEQRRIRVPRSKPGPNTAVQGEVSDGPGGSERADLGGGKGAGN